MKRCNVKPNTLQFDFCIFYSSETNLSKTKKPSHRQHQSAGALLSLLQMMSYVTALKFKIIPKAYCFLIPHHLRHSPRTVSTKVRSAIIFSLHIAGFRRTLIRNQSHRYSIVNFKFDLLYHTEHLFAKNFMKMFLLIYSLQL